MPRRRGLTVLGPVVLLGVWEVLSRAEIIHPAFFPPPTAIAQRLPVLWQPDGLAPDLLATVGRLAATALLASFVGVALGLLVFLVPRLHAGMESVLAFLYPIPAVLFFPIIALALGRGEVALVVTAAVTPFIIAFFAAAAGARAIDPVLLEAASNYGASGRALFLRVLVPGSLSRVIPGLRIALGFSLITVVATEMVGASRGLGAYLWTSWRTLRVGQMYVALVAIAVLGLLLAFGYDAVVRRLTPWVTARD